MANSSDSVNSWPGLVNQLNKTFLLIRDVFGYALPGGLFLAIGVVSGRLSVIHVQSLLNWYNPPVWALFVLLLAACYLVGDILATLAYLPIAIRKYFQWRPYMKHHLYPLRDGSVQVEPAAKEVDFLIGREGIEGALVVEQQINEADLLMNRPTHLDRHQRKKAAAIDLLLDNPTEVTGDLLEIKLRHPEFFEELERRETLLILAGANMVALLGGTLIFYLLPFYGWLVPAWLIFVSAGVIIFCQFLTGPAHLRRVRFAIRQADNISTTTGEQQ